VDVIRDESRGDTEGDFERQGIPSIRSVGEQHIVGSRLHALRGIGRRLELVCPHVSG